MVKKNTWIYVAIMGILSLMIVIWSITTAESSKGLVQFKNDVPAYKNLIPVEEDHIHIAYDLQAIPFLKAGVAKEHRTDFVGTIIIAVDRDQVEDSIEGWNCLRNVGYKVYFGYRGKLSHIDFGYTILAISSGLGFQYNRFDNTIHLLRTLQSNGHLSSSNLSEAPIAILFDYQAAQMIKEGRNLEIVVPVEGTLSFPIGLMSTDSVKLPEIKPSDLIAAGFRLSDGESDASIYPSSDNYSPVQNAVLTNESGTALVRSIALFRRQVLGERRFSPANGLENLLLYLAFIVIIVLWSGLLFIRISDKALQKHLLSISILLLMWMFVRIVRLVLPSGIVDRVFWYLYYIPLIFLPTLLFWIGQIITQNYEKQSQKLLKKTIFGVSLLLTVLVLTNDMHQWAFHFYNGMEGNNYDLYYRNSWVYYIVFSWSLLLIFSFIIVAVRYKSDSTAKRAGPLVIIVFLSVIYFGGYAYGIRIFRESEFSIVYGLMSLVFLEACFQSRLIPNNIKLGKLLSKAPIDLHIISDNLHVEYKTDMSAELSSKIIDYLEHTPLTTDIPTGISVPDNDSLLYSVYRINGGYSVFAQHLESVIRLRVALTEQNQKIQVQNSILSKTHSIRSEIARLKMQQELYGRIDDVLKDRVNRINIILSVLTTSQTDHQQDTLQKQLAIIKILVNYCKRRGNLALLEASDEYCQTASLALWFQESIWEANANGVEGFVTESANIEIPSGLAALLYDCFQQILEDSMRYSNVILMVNLSAREDNMMIRIIVEAQSTIELSNHLLDGEIFNRLNLIDGTCNAYKQENGLIIEISAPVGGFHHD